MICLLSAVGRSAGSALFDVMFSTLQRVRCVLHAPVLPEANCFFHGIGTEYAVLVLINVLAQIDIGRFAASDSGEDALVLPLLSEHIVVVKLDFENGGGLRGSSLQARHAHCYEYVFLLLAVDVANAHFRHFLWRLLRLRIYGSHFFDGVVLVGGEREHEILRHDGEQPAEAISKGNGDCVK